MRPVELLTDRREQGAPGKRSPAVVAFIKPKASAPKLHHPDAQRQSQNHNQKPPSINARGFLVCRSVTEPAPSPRLRASAWARPLADLFTLTGRLRPNLQNRTFLHCWGLGHFYFALTAPYRGFVVDRLSFVVKPAEATCRSPLFPRQSAGRHRSSVRLRGRGQIPLDRLHSRPSR